MVAFHAASPLQTAAEQQRVTELAARCGCRLVRFPFAPFAWPEFVANSPSRCYLCKKRNYSHFLAALTAYGCSALLDGTNADDLHDERPGLAALRELGVRTPLAAEGLRKEDVRECARAIGLPVWNAPSSSCLATRIPHGQPITPENIGFVAMVEEYLMGQGFWGCRVRWGAERLTIEVRKRDIPRFNALSDTPSFRKMASQKGFKAFLVTQRIDR
ncbi:MAG: TIGR00268 family protein [Thermodesulfobacteriota bacterium]